MAETLNTKLETLNKPKTQNSKSRRFDLADRTLTYAKKVIEFTGMLPKTAANHEIIKQLIRSSGSIGANYIEAEEALSKKDFAMRIKISRKEAKETRYWLSLVEAGENSSREKEALVQEATELTKIFGSIVEKTK